MLFRKTSNHNIVISNTQERYPSMVHQSLPMLKTFMQKSIKVLRAQNKHLRQIRQKLNNSISVSRMTLNSKIW